MREKKYHIYLTDDEQSRVIQSLINLKNNLIVQTTHFFLISYRSFRLNRNQSGEKQQRCEYPNFLSYQTFYLHFKRANPLLDSYKL